MLGEFVAGIDIETMPRWWGLRSRPKAKISVAGTAEKRCNEEDLPLVAVHRARSKSKMTFHPRRFPGHVFLLGKLVARPAVLKANYLLRVINVPDQGLF